MSDLNKKIHDIRNPLNTISMNAELGKLSLQTAQDIERAIAAFDLIIRECQVCGESLTELKKMTSVESDE